LNESPVAAIEKKEQGVLLRVRVQPRSSRNAIHVEPDGRIRVTLTAAPVEGEANEALVAFVAAKVGLAKRAVTLVRGGKSREKVLSLAGVDVETVRDRLRTG